MFNTLLGGKRPEEKGSKSQKSKVVTAVSDDVKLIKDISNALDYDGFNVAKVRSKAIEIMSYGTILTLLVAYIKTGNSLAKKVQAGKLVDKGVAASVLEIMKKCGVVQKATSAESITLPRLAIAFAALVIVIREQLKLPPRVETSTPLAFQDLCLNGYVNIDKISVSQDFIEKFSWILAQALNKANQSKKGWVDLTPESSKKKLEEYRSLAKLSQSADELGLTVLKTFTADMPLAKVASLYTIDVASTALEINESKAAELNTQVDQEEGTAESDQ